MKRLAPRLLWALLCLSLAWPAAAKDDDDIALTELVKILRDQGVLDEKQYETLSVKAAAQQDERSWLDRVEIWGQLRARWESFYYFSQASNDELNRDDRQRLRYRILLNLKGNVNEYSDVFIQLATGSDSRTTNNTIGDAFDYATNGIYLQYAYARLSPFPGGEIPDADGSLHFYFGKTPQPFRWGIGKDFLLWDDELSLSGFYGKGDLQLTEELQGFANAGFFVIDENSSGKDPMMTSLQLGVHNKGDGAFDFGGRATWYAMFELNQAFFNRGINAVGPSTGSNALVGSGAAMGFPVSGATTAAGNIPGGLTDGSFLNVIEFGLYARAHLIERWPILLFADISQNVDATRGFISEALVPACGPAGCAPGDNGLAWLIGFDIGDSHEYFRFRMLYAWIEANAFPSQFIDSDLFDGFTNGRGFYWDVVRQLSENVYANFTAMYSEPIHTGVGYLLPGASPQRIPVSNRLRTQANVVWEF